MIVYIHGAHMSSKSFNYIRKSLPFHESFLVEYNVMAPLDNILSNIKNELQDIKEPYDIIAHSIGGVFALRLLQDKFPINKIVTLSTPFGGVEFNNHFLDMMRNPFLIPYLPQDMKLLLAHTDNIGPHNYVFRELHRKSFDATRIRAVVTNTGRMFMSEQNDMVVTVKSQKYFSRIAHKEINCSHGEVLLHDDVIDYIKDYFGY